MPPQPFTWPFPAPPQGWPNTPQPLPDTSALSSAVNDNEDGEESDQSAESDVIHLLSEEEANQFREPAVFDPTVRDDSSWQPPEVMLKYLETNFDRNLTEPERTAILSDFPIPQCSVLQAPTLDPEVKDQIRKKGKNPQFGTERCLFNLQEELLGVTGPLTCLWADLLNPTSDLTKEDIIFQVQRALCMVGSTYHSMNVERRKLAWSRINPSLKPLAEEKYEKREGKLFGPTFVEKASKKLEADKALAKVSYKPQSAQSSSSRKRSYEEDPSDLRRFLSKGAPAQYGGKGKQRLQKPYSQSKKQYQKFPNQAKKPRTVTYQPRQ